MKLPRILPTVVATGFVAGIISVQASTSSWTGATDSFWFTASNWSPSGPPGTGNDILFPLVSNQTVDLGSGFYDIGTLTFNSPNAYTLVSGGLTLGGDVLQNGAGAVTFNAGVELGGVNRTFAGPGSGVVALNGAVTDNLAIGARATLAGASYVIGNAANTIDRFTISNGTHAKIVGTAPMQPYPSPSYFGGNGGSGGAWITVNGGVLDWQVTQVDSGYGAGTLTTTMLAEWADHGVIFGPNGGTLLFNQSYPPAYCSVYHYSYATNGTPGTIVVGQPMPFTGDGRGDNWRGPWDVEQGGAVAGAYNVGNNQRRFGEGDLSLIVTNGGMAYLDFSVMTNGYFRVYGQPGGDSSAAEVDGLGTTKNVGRLALRGPHRGTQYFDENIPAGHITRSFYMNQPWGMAFYGAVQIWNRDGPERFACDMSFESGSSVDICGGKWTRYLDLGHVGNGYAGIAGPTNTLTIKGGGKLNLNVQMRTQQWEGNGPANGESSGVRVFANTVIDDGGQLKLYRSQNNTTRVKSIEFFRPITGRGNSINDAVIVVDLPYAVANCFSRDGSGNNLGGPGVNFDTAARTELGGAGNSYPSSEIGPWLCTLVVNGSGRYGLKLVGNNSFIDNVIGTPGYSTGNPYGTLEYNRMESLSGSGGVLTLAATNTSGQMTLFSGPTNGNPGSIRLGFLGNLGHTYVVNAGTVTNFAGLLVKSARVKLGNGLGMGGKNLRVGDEGGAIVALDDASTVTFGQLVLIGDTTLEMGTAGGSAAVLNFASTASAPWTPGKTLSINYWNGNTSGGGTDQVRFGTDTGGLTSAQLAQIRWIAPNGGPDVAGAKALPTGEIVPADSTPPAVASPAVLGGQFVFQVAGSPGQTCVVQSATNLIPPVVWTNVLTNSGVFNFTTPVTMPQSFFRVLGQ